MVLVAVYREPLIRLSQLNARLTGGIWGYIFVKRVLLVIVCVKNYKRLKINEISEEIRHVMLFHYRKGYNASQTCREICTVYCGDAVTDRTVRNWLERFRGENFDVKDLPRSSRPLTEKADEILQLSAIDRHESCQGIADALGINHQTVWNHLKKAGYTKKNS